MPSPLSGRQNTCVIFIDSVQKLHKTACIYCYIMNMVFD